MKRRMVRNAAQALLALALLIEAGARLGQPWLIRHSAGYYTLALVDALVKRDPVLILAGRPHANADLVNSAGESVNYNLNAIGWRDKEFNPLELIGNALVFGDSNTYGVGVPYGKRYTELLENGFHGLDVWNASGIGYAPDQYLLLAERWLPPVPWIFLLVQLSAGDPEAMARHEWRSVNPQTGIPAELRPPRALSLFSRYSEGWNFLLFLGTLGAGKPAEAELEAGLQRVLFCLRETAKLAEWRHVPMLLLQANGWGEGDYGEKVAREYREGVASVVREHGLRFVDAGELPVSPYPDGHWAEAAHHRAAELLFPLVKDVIFTRKAPTQGRKKR